VPRKPTLKAIEKEARAMLPVALAMVPVAYRVRYVSAVEGIKDAKAQVHFDDSADGGRCIDISVSRTELEGDWEHWRLRVLIRIVHELAHVRTADNYATVLSVIGTKYEKILSEFWETTCAVPEGVALYALQNGMKV
jgi:hypothetical protein